MNAVITGGSRGIGFAAAKELANDGYNLIITFNSNVQRAEQAKKELQERYKVKVFIVKGDLSDESAIDSIFESVEKNFGNKLQAFVHNAGAAIGITSEAETTEAKRAADNYKQDIGQGTFCDFATYDYFQNIYPKCFIRCVEKCVKIMEDNNGYIVAVSTYGSNHLQTPKPKYAITAQAKGCMELLVCF